MMLSSEALQSTLLITLGVCIIILFSLFLLIMRRLPKKAKEPAPFTISYSSDILTGFDNWFAKSLQIYVIRYIDDKKGKEYVTDDDLNMSSAFAIEGVKYVTNQIANSVPAFYRNYMSIFYGPDQFTQMMYERIRAVFIEFVANETTRRRRGDLNKRS